MRVPGRVSEQAAARWARDQAIHAQRHAAALRPFRRDEFGTGLATPSRGQLRAVNDIVRRLRASLLRRTAAVASAAEQVSSSGGASALQALLRAKDIAHRAVRTIETIWDFYLQVFGQRTTAFGDWLYVCDRIALDCYQAAYTGLDTHRPVPAPPPFCFMQSGRSPATFRRNVRLKRLAAHLNPFPLIQIPYHRLVNPWTLGAILHEVGHNLQNDLGLARAVPDRIESALRQQGVPGPVARVWRRWNREAFADLIGLLLGGPGVVDSLLDVLGRSPGVTESFNPRGVHPTPYLRAFISFELRRRLGFPRRAARQEAMWRKLYPAGGRDGIPAPVLASFPIAHRIVVEQVCFQPFESLGGKPLAAVIRFRPKDQAMIREAAGRLAAGTPTGVLPERFLIGAARDALHRRLTTPGRLTQSFYSALSGGPR
ncbi:MAG: hypothetical protein IPM29_06925 [Planctomycetes bacterium]|nr:hypothetical protein [Planctomycetota bacterium]